MSQLLLLLRTVLESSGTVAHKSSAIPEPPENSLLEELAYCPSIDCTLPVAVRARAESRTAINAIILPHMHTLQALKRDL